MSNNWVRKRRDQDERPPFSWWGATPYDLTAVMQGESVRGAGVLARSYIESALDECLLQHALKEVTNRQAIALAIGGGLKRKIDVCSELRLVRRRALVLMDLIREYGDAFAHRPDLITAEDPYVRAILADLREDLSKGTGSVDANDPNRVIMYALTVAIGHLGNWLSHGVDRAQFDHFT